RPSGRRNPNGEPPERGDPGAAAQPLRGLLVPGVCHRSGQHTAQGLYGVHFTISTGRDLPVGAVYSTVSPTLAPWIALPSGDAVEKTARPVHSAISRVQSRNVRSVRAIEMVTTMPGSTTPSA